MTVLAPPLPASGVPPTAPAPASSPRVFRWTREEFMRVHSLLTFRGRKVELISGQIRELEPMNSPHAACVSKSRHQLAALFGSMWDVRVQLPLDVSRDTMPFPTCWLCLSARIFM